ncbi:hypothetical protein [Rhodovulum sulfidophilum]|uniref:hypothetical protein n=1 Tax=Rhodovulum sulfidophilum TaxID=35806 RepID=UPI0019222D04|nr:hypothetical protein [Rhodovulum sulfidophilum]MBL3559760.1 hypothetical protein [Rhodovulum sulfidophilum]
MVEMRSIVDTAGGRSAGPAPEPVPSRTEPRLARLVLTPNLRVRPDPETRSAPARAMPVLLRGPLPQEPGAPALPVAREVAPSGRRTASVADLAEANRRDAVTLERRIAELEAAMAGVDADWDPECEEGFPAAPWVGKAQAMAAGPAAGLGDEAALRLMVSDIVREVVRQELRGTLGEGIGRNLRKMVRRELGRALAERDLD